MNARETINTALISRGLLPMDGDCTCDRCGATGLDRDQVSTVEPHQMIWRRAARIGTHFCARCIDLLYLEAENAANPHLIKRAPPTPCPHHEKPIVVNDAVRGTTHTEWCSYCNGDKT